MVIKQFLSTPSVRRATQGGQLDAGVLDISIHALREEGDQRVDSLSVLGSLFLSTPSVRRATLSRADQALDQFEFLSTPSVRRATMDAGAGGCAVLFLSTPSVRRATCLFLRVNPALRYFYPRPP